MQTNTAKLESDVRVFLVSNPQATFDQVCVHIVGLGWNLMHHEMFYDWLRSRGINVIK